MISNDQKKNNNTENEVRGDVKVEDCESEDY
jgi:hypothetical protein